MARNRCVRQGRRKRIERHFLDDIRGQKVLDEVRRSNKALLVLHSPIDEIVGIEQARRIYESAHHPKSFVSLDQADHLLTRREDADYAAGVIAAWASRYLPGTPAVKQAESESVDGAVVVREQAPPFLQEVRAGAHTFPADEPEKWGGADLGPNPYDYLLAALGACTNMTLRGYAKRKGWPLDGLAITLRHQHIHAEDCEECETEEGKIDRIDRELSLEGALDDSQRERLLEIADRCPVHRTLTTETHVVTRLVRA